MVKCVFFSFQESGDDEYHGEHSDTEDEVDSDFDIDEGDEPDSDQEEDAPRRKSRVVTKAYKVSTVISSAIKFEIFLHQYLHQTTFMSLK